MSKEVKLTKTVVFKGKKVRKTIHNNEWWFCVMDIINVLTNTNHPWDGSYKMKIRKKEEGRNRLSTIYRRLPLQSSDGKQHLIDCVNTEGIFHILQLIPASKA